MSVLTQRAAPEPPTPYRVEALYLDDALLIIDKPAGLPVHPSSRYLEGTVVNRLRQQYGVGFAAPVHRLDRETSGVLVCARHRAAARALSRAFEAGAVYKEYLAICEGVPIATRLSIDAPIAVGGAVIRIGVRIDVACGRAANTVVEQERVFERDGAVFSLLRAMPRTGRRHQIRVHLRALGVPVVGDKIYGPSEHLYERFALGLLDAAGWRALRLPRQALHAAAISLLHPTTGEPLRVQAPLPADLRGFMGPGGHPGGPVDMGWVEP